MIPLSSPVRSYLSQKLQIDAAIARVLSSGHYLMGPELELFELEFAHFLKSGIAVGVNSGTDGLAIALASLGIGPGDEVITVSHTAVATVSAIEQVGATPVLVDVDQHSRTIDFDLVSAFTSSRTRAVIPVHLYGMPIDVESAMNFRKQTGIPMIEDCSQAHGAMWRGQSVGTFGDIAVFSCYPTKNLGALGDAGVVVTPHLDLATKMRRIRQYGWEHKQFSIEAGRNSRLDEIQAAILRVKLQNLPADNARRREIAAIYNRGLSGLTITCPQAFVERYEVFHLFVCETAERELLLEKLKNNDIQAGIHYPHPVHTQPAFSKRLCTSSMDNTTQLCQRIISLPMFPQLTDDEVAQVVTTLQSLLS